MTGTHSPLRSSVALGLATLALVGSLACSSKSTTATPTTTTRIALTAATATTMPHLSATQKAHRIGTTFAFKSFLVTMGQAVYDSSAKELLVGIHFHNVSGEWAQAEVAGTLTSKDGASTAISGAPINVPPGAQVNATATASNVASDPASGGTIAWGYDSFDQPVVSIDGKHDRNLWLPRTQKVNGWAHIGKFGVHLSEVQMQAGAVDQNLQAPVGKRILRAVVDEYTARGTTNPFTAAQNLTLKLPNGKVVDAVDGSSAASQLSWTSKGELYADFEVPAALVGHYELLLSSMTKLGFGTIRPELIEHRPIFFTIANAKPGELTGQPPIVYPDLTKTEATTQSKGFTMVLPRTKVNIAGFIIEPKSLTFDPDATTATMKMDVTNIQTDLGQPGGLLSVPPSYGATEVLVSNGKFYTGTVSGDSTIDTKKPTRVTITFLNVSDLDRNDLGIYVGDSNGVASSAPLTPGSQVPLYPPAVVTKPIKAPTVTAGDWTVKLESYRIGLLNRDLRPPPGTRDLEVTMKVSASPTSKVRALGLSFEPQYQFLLADDSGYDQGAIADSGFLPMKPGQQVTMSATFEVPDSFDASSLAFVVRSRSEIGDLGTSFVETRFMASLGSGSTDSTGEVQ